MKKVFIDTDVILDFLLNRDPYINEITEIIEKCVTGEMTLCVSSLTISNLHYIISRIENKKSANNKIRKILKLLKVENVGQTTIIKAMESEFGDFEDGIQNYCAEEADHKVLVTRNTKDYKKSSLAIMTPKEFLARPDAARL
ncbi:MAG: PIN domain-containing protein [Saprospiraceae bacterium]|nr:PIN domain-containing protein [Saprospiraceae bacterium]